MSNKIFNTGNAKIVSGSYIGTGTYGIDNKNIIELSFIPKMIIVNKKDALTGTSEYGGWREMFIWSEGMLSTKVNYSGGGSSNTIYFEINNNFFSWYAQMGSSNDGSQQQLNSQNIEYNYTIIG